MSRSEPSAFVGNTSFAFTTASEFACINVLSRARFSTNNVAGMEPYRVCNFMAAECDGGIQNKKWKMNRVAGLLILTFEVIKLVQMPRTPTNKNPRVRRALSKPWEKT